MTKQLSSYNNTNKNSFNIQPIKIKYNINSNLLNIKNNNFDRIIKLRQKKYSYVSCKKYVRLDDGKWFGDQGMSWVISFPTIYKKYFAYLKSDIITKYNSQFPIINSIKSNHFEILNETNDKITVDLHLSIFIRILDENGNIMLLNNLNALSPVKVKPIIYFLPIKINYKPVNNFSYVGKTNNNWKSDIIDTRLCRDQDRSFSVGGDGSGGAVAG